MSITFRGKSISSKRICLSVIKEEWIISIQKGDPIPSTETAAKNYEGQGPRGENYDKMSPPLGYPSHEHSGRTTTWFTYAMGRMSATSVDSAVIFELRDAPGFVGVTATRVAFEKFVELAYAIAKEEGLPD